MIFSVSPVQSTSPVHQSSPLVQSSDCRQSVKSRGKEEMSLGTRLLRDKTMSPLRLRNFEEGASLFQPPPPTGNEAWSRGRRFRFELGFSRAATLRGNVPFQCFGCTRPPTHGLVPLHLVCTFSSTTAVYLQLKAQNSLR